MYVMRGESASAQGRVALVEWWWCTKAIVLQPYVSGVGVSLSTLVY